MEIGLILSLVKLSLEVFKDERKDRFLKKYIRLEKEWHEEMAKPDSKRSDLALDRILLECKLLARLVVSEANGK
jgi:hypothetical protein